MLDRRRRPSARPRRRAVRPGDRARGRHLDRADVGAAGRHRRERGASPDHARLRQHAAARGARRPPARRASGRGQRLRPSRIAVEGAPASRRDPAQGRRAASVGGDGLARARDRHRARGARLPARVPALDRDIPAASGTSQPFPSWDAERAAVSDHPGRARRMHGPASSGTRRQARQLDHPRASAGRARPADRGRGGRRGVARGGAVRPRSPGCALRGPLARRLRGRAGAGLRRCPDRPRATREIPSSRPGERRAASAPRRSARRADLRRRHPRAGRLPRRRRAPRHVRRHRQRGLRDRGRHRQRVPARHAPVADPAGHARARARRRRDGQATQRPVLVRRGARAHRGALGGGRRPPVGGREAASRP